MDAIATLEELAKIHGALSESSLGQRNKGAAYYHDGKAHAFMEAANILREWLGESQEPASAAKEAS